MKNFFRRLFKKPDGKKNPPRMDMPPAMAKQMLNAVQQTEEVEYSCDDVYRLMDFATRDRYRHAVEFFAGNSQRSEGEIAQQAIALAADNAKGKGRADRASHVGFYLTDRGQHLLARRIQMRWPWRTVIARSIRRFPLTFYAGGIGLLTGLATLAFLLQMLALGVSGLSLAALTALFLLGASQPAVALMNGLAMLLAPPLRLPRLDTSSGIAPDCRTMVVIPTLLSSLEGIDPLLRP